MKLYMTYEPMKLGDRLDIMVATRKIGTITMIHAENRDMVELYGCSGIESFESC